MGNSDSTISTSLFDSNETTSIVCFTSTKFDMNSGYQKEFAKRFGGIGWLRNQNVQNGKALAVQDDLRFIYYLTLKVHNYDSTDEATLVSALGDMITHASQNGVTKIALPASTSHWIPADVYKQKLDEAFNGTDITYTLH